MIQTSSMPFIWLISPQAPDTHLCITHPPTHTHSHTHDYKRTKARINLINYLEFKEHNGKVESQIVVQNLGDC